MPSFFWTVLEPFPLLTASEPLFSFILVDDDEAFFVCFILRDCLFPVFQKSFLGSLLGQKPSTERVLLGFLPFPEELFPLQ